MRKLPDIFIAKLEKIAGEVDAEKRLYFFGLVHHDLLPWDRWDIILSAEKLVPWSTDAITYIAGLLRKNLTDPEMIKIAQVVALPQDDELIRALSQDEQTPAGRIPGLHPADQFDQVVVIWSPSKSPGQTAEV